MAGRQACVLSTSLHSMQELCAQAYKGQLTSHPMYDRSWQQLGFSQVPRRYMSSAGTTIKLSSSVCEQSGTRIT